MLRRTTLSHVNKVLEKNPNWKILDIGCGYRPHKYATVIADTKDFTNLYKEKKFVKVNGETLPFKDKEFDFVIASHVIEHVEDFQFFIKELERIASKGYIELPSRLGDNLVFENKNDHIWWFYYDDISNELIASERNQLINPFITVSMAKLLEGIFKESLTIELAWEDKIEHKIDNRIRHKDFKTISFFKIFRKYLSKKIRSIFR